MRSHEISWETQWDSEKLNEIFLKIFVRDCKQYYRGVSNLDWNHAFFERIQAAHDDFVSRDLTMELV